MMKTLLKYFLLIAFLFVLGCKFIRDPMDPRLVGHVWYLARNGEVYELMPMIERHTNYLQLRDTNTGDTLLHASSRGGHLTCSVFLYAEGISVNATNWQGETPIYLAAESGELKLVEYLVQEGADLISEATGDTPLHRAASAGHSNVAAFLLEQGLSPNKTNTEGFTAMHLALIHYTNSGVVELLQSAKGNIEYPLPNGQTLYERANLSNDIELSNLIHEYLFQNLREERAEEAEASLEEEKAEESATE